MGSGEAEGGRTDPESVSFTHRLLNTHITALSTKENVVFIGEGQHCHAHDVASGRQVASTQVFRAAAVHGLRVQPSPGDSRAAWLVLAFGQKSLAVLLYLAAEGKFVVLQPESTVEDWIVDAGLEKDLSHIVVATGHNSLLRCQTPDLAERCRNLWEHTSELEPEASPGTQEAESIDLMHRVKEGGRTGNLTVNEDERIDGLAGKEEGSRCDQAVREDGRSSGLVMTDDDRSGILAVKEEGRSDGLSIKKDERSGDLVVKKDRRSRNLAMKGDGKGSGLSVMSRVACVERCVLFSGHLVMMSGRWEGAVMLAGTMALQVMVWAPWGPRNSDGNALPLHCLWGHQGSIFSITFNPSQGLITTTSDDRSLRVWEVVRQDTSPHPTTTSTIALPNTPDEEQLYWTSAKITEKSALFGHRARVWRSLILPSCLVSVGEDSIVCIWDHSGALMASWRAHEGASIWSVAATEGAKGRLITGGADGSVKTWSMSAMVPVRAEPVDGLPWGGSLGVDGCVGPAEGSSEVTTGQRDSKLLLNTEDEGFSLPEAARQEAVTIKMKSPTIEDFPGVAKEKTDDNGLLLNTKNEKSNTSESGKRFRKTRQERVSLEIRSPATEDFAGVTKEKADLELLLNSEGGECNAPGTRELFRDTPQKTVRETPTPTSTEASMDRFGDTNTLPESHELFSDAPHKKTPTKPKITTDFPRCLGLLGDGLMVVVTNCGKIYSKIRERSWCLEYEDERLSNYSILEASPERGRVAVGTLTGDIVVLRLGEGSRLVVEAVAEGLPGKVFALQWLTAGRVLALGASGVMTTWEIQPGGKIKAVNTHHLPVSMHRWLCAVYVPSADTPTSDISTPAVTPYLVCGDRAGSLHLYTLTDPKPQDTLRGIHGKNGVTSLLSWGGGGVVYSSGRDGCVRSLRVCAGGGDGGCPRLQPLTVTRVCRASWVARLLCVWGKLLAVCFHGVKLVLWDVKAEQELLEVECGGAHRSWDLVVCGEEGGLVCGFLKDGVPHTFSTSLSDKLLPIIKPPLNSQETMGVCVLPQPGRETLLVTAGEDTTLRLHALSHPGHLRPLGVLRSHLSGVRALCVVESLGVIVENGEKEGKYSELRGQIVDGSGDDDARVGKDSEMKGCMEDDDDSNGSKDNDNRKKRHMVDSTQDEDSNSPGNSNDAKNNEDRKQEKEHITDDLQDNNTSEDNSANERKRKEQATDATKHNGTLWMVSAGGRAEFKLWHCTLDTPTSASVPCGTPTHPPGQTTGGEGKKDDLSVTCREVGSHMLRTGSHKTWRHQQLTFDPETRYMAAAAFWVTSSVALVALASSDGFLRLFSFQAGGETSGKARGREEMRLAEVCAVECGSCLLSVARLGGLTRAVLVTCSTRGQVTFWDLQDTVEWVSQHTAPQEEATPLSHSPPQPRQLTTVAAHQSGINSITFHHHRDPTRITMATGGDDNKISVWEVVVVEENSGVEVVVTERCCVFGHASQVSGLAWLSAEHLLSTSIDQRLTVWKYNRDTAMQTEPTEDVIFHTEPRELNKTAGQENRTIEKETTEAKTTYLEPEEQYETTRQGHRTTREEPLEDGTDIQGEPFMTTRQEDRTTKKEPEKDRTTCTEPDEQRKTGRHGNRTTDKEPRPEENITNRHSLTPIGSCFSGVPDVKGLVVTDIDDGKKKKGKKKGRITEKKVFVYGMGMQVFDVTVGDTVR
ncbi:uncharacterized protein LOC126999789 [Eriocheir sinensis]|uniref:uncharacterized protein LOC126999789 n=1 Tax=Eriocheir sinensis TaxID=95602 RepID=UPI0021C6FE22|nr:uncharacterized protein LOC126999789 [Eriocheir sinensis]